MDLDTLIDVAEGLCRQDRDVLIIGIPGTGAETLVTELRRRGIEVCGHASAYEYDDGVHCNENCRVRWGCGPKNTMSPRGTLTRALSKLDRTRWPEQLDVVTCDYDQSRRTYVGDVSVATLR